MDEARHKIIGGKSGFGKSYRAGADMEEFVLDEGYFGVVLDIKPTNEDDEIGDHRGLSEDIGFVRMHIESASEIEDASVENLMNVLEQANRVGRKGIRFTADITVPEIQDAMPSFADKVCRAIMRLDFSTVILIEEVQYVAPHQNQGGRRDDFRGLVTILGLGRTSDKIALMTTQEFGKVHTAVYGECNVYIIYFMGKKERKYNKVLDPSKDAEDKEAIRELKRSKKKERKYIYYDSNIGVTEIRSSKGLTRRTRHID